MKIATFLLLAGCTRPNPQYCDDNADCSEGFCDLQRRECAPIDAAPPQDHRGFAGFDVAYPDQWRFSVPGPVSGYLMIVNTGKEPLKTESLVVQSVVDDHAAAVVRVTATGYGTIPQGYAGGLLAGKPKMLLVDSGLVAEPRAETDSDYLTIEIGNAPADDVTIAAIVTLELEGGTVAMPMSISWTPSVLPEVWADGLHGARTPALR